MEVGGQFHAPAALLSRGNRTRDPLNRKLGGLCGEKKNLTTEGKQTPAAQPVARCSTDCAV
jgi:hypothetical protein